MKETIVLIEENMQGFTITTTTQKISLGIIGGQRCCEDFGCFMTNDNLSEFIGAKILGITLVDDMLETKGFDHALLLESDSCLMFVNIETDNGTLQFTAYNEHNGYYGHDAFVRSEQLKHTEEL